jgi:hypothetical protein
VKVTLRPQLSIVSGYVVRGPAAVDAPADAVGASGTFVPEQAPSATMRPVASAVRRKRESRVLITGLPVRGIGGLAVLP